MEKGLTCPHRIRRRAIAALAGAAFFLPAAAHAGAIAVDFTGPPAYVEPGCATALSPAAGPAASPVSKSAALLGGAVSALDAIRLQQQAVIQPRQGLAGPVLADMAGGLARLTPGINAAIAPSQPCIQLAAVRTPSALPGMGAPVAAPTDPEQFLASKRIHIGRTNFDKDWQRVRSEKVSLGVARRNLGTLSGDREDTLSRVNRWVNRAITYREDRDLFGTSDYWAGARRTLKLRKGDCEDIALLKMQLLAAAGIPREDMILTIARDLVRQADHAVLIVRSGAGYRLLDNASDDVLDAAPQHDYRAILSFGASQTWLHGA